MDGPTAEQVAQAIQLLDEHLETCTEDPCPGVDDELRAIHPDLVMLSQTDYPADDE